MPAAALPDEASLSPHRRWRALPWVLGALVALAVAVALILGAAASDSLRHSQALTRLSGDLGLALASGDAAAVASSRSRIDAHVDTLARAAQPTRPELELVAGWQQARRALDADQGALVAVVAFRRAAAAMAESDRARAGEDRRRREALLAAASMLAASAIVGTAMVLRRQRRQVGRHVRDASRDLGSGNWQTAVQSLRDERLGPPSAFDALASGFEQVIGSSERRWQALADLTADWYWETDASHRLQWLSGSGPLLDLLGLQPADLLGRRHDAIAAFEPPAGGWAALQVLLDSRHTFRDIEFHAVGNQGRAAWLAISGRPRLDEAGRFAGYEGVGRDISVGKAALLRLRESEERWSMMVRLASDYYLETDAEHRVLPMRPEISVRFGDFAGQVEGRTPWEAYPDAMTPERWAQHRAEIAARRPYRGVEIEIDRGDGQHRTVSISGLPRLDEQGRFLGYRTVGRDITLRREAERLLLRHNDILQRTVAARTQTLEQLNRDLDAFARELAHELRTPIGHVQGLIELIATRTGDRLAPDDRDLMALAARAASQMGETVDALLLLARSTLQPIELETVDLTALAHDVIAALPPAPRHVPVVWDIQPALTVRAAAAPLRLVLTNLFGNAEKFSRASERPRVALTGHTSPDGRLYLKVQDNGVGFDPALADQLFRPFGRLHPGDRYPGTGIGLTVVQRIVERHGGTVRAVGRSGGGAIFEFSLEAADPVRT